MVIEVSINSRYTKRNDNVDDDVAVAADDECGGCFDGRVAVFVSVLVCW